MKVQIPSIPVSSSPEDIAKAIEGSHHGILTVTGLPVAVPFDEIISTFDHLSGNKDLTDRLNRAYPKNLVYKDAHANQKGGPTIDMKRVLDLSPDRLQEMKRNDPKLAVVEREGALGETLAYWERLRTDVAPKLVKAVGLAIGCPGALQEDSAFNYRMVDYYERNRSSIPPRCGEHRDFGSFTLVFPSHGGLQLFVDDQWVDVAVPNTGDAILLFGWCTQIRSNGRIPAVLHRVTDHAGDATNNAVIIPRRVAAVLFCAPKRPETALKPVVREGEEPKYISGIQAGQLRGSMARKWQVREGTIKPEDLVLEEAEILATQMRTQDDVVHQTIAA